MAGRRKTYNEEEALDKAISVFWKKGYDNASSRDLQKAMGIGQGSFYLAYKDGKKELFEKSLNHFLAKYPKVFLDMLKTLDNPIEALRQYFYVLTEPDGLFGQLGCYFSPIILQVSDKDLKTMAIQKVLVITTGISDALLRAKRAGVIKSQLPEELWNIYLLNMWTGLNTTKFIEKDPVKLRALIDFKLKVFEDEFF
ncbi:TetR/AcrR family transcriptional regulator [Mucilaginibacter rubeus]|uniref:TetR/AcrR family transcriptional regulator n=1 Tax=Mucilaginibacter rubeus TaxID=2027860 RepID=A0AAE6JK85_9SPHI|nr:MULTISPECIES: TetR/AcrR family transcriptional regulator [Mucilaginibacter]QEM07166.1 TetR/AcrR family transcriptional regulator [Mucilaginibacter rubeus]QEM19620.1 TetR/AcrR family transcriptional regulator [Mucilaginibacter gossypii]QTE43688.1 TetR/AcrR family transcriptional regulator [Mucilaginibacter rubeus]QTE50288.1 TetR/AcrR family transcriptional regulator [Mucilaginibacter rubeus]QTE55375.1 TetR/AcrR family transcriptional regulator [Mucilaginibacter rubeus]